MLLENLAGPRAARVWLSVFASLFVLITVTSSWAQEPWSARHHDGMRTGRAGGTAAISMPTVSWQHPLGTGVAGASVLIADVLGDDTPESLALVNGAVVARDSITDVVRWDTAPLGVTRFGGAHDFNGDDRPEILLIGTIVVLLDGESGNVVWRATPADPNTLSFRAPAAIAHNTDTDPELELVFGHGGRELYLYDFSDGFSNVDPVWSMTDTSLPTSVFRPVIGEFDGDIASQEIAIVNIQSCRVVFVSLADGTLLRRTEAHTSGVFCYGLTQAANVDDDPEDEIVFTGNLGRGRGSVTLTVYDYATDAPLWQHEYGTSGVDPRTTLAPAGAVADFDGDGDREIAIAVYDNQTESRGDDDGINYPDGWVVVIYDASDGSTLGSIQDATIHGITDLDNDGSHELLTLTAAPGEATPDEVGTLRAWSLDGNRAPSMLWEIADVSPITQPLPPNARIQSRDYDRLPAIFDGDDGPDWILVSTGENPATIMALDPNGDQVDVAAETQFPGTAGIQLIDEGDDILGSPHVVLRSSAGDFTIHNDALVQSGDLTIIGHSSEVLIVPLVTGTGMQVVYRNSANQVVGLDVSSANQLQQPTVLWTRDAGVTGDIVSFDADDDGTYEVAFAGRLEDDTPFVELVDGDGTRIWQRTFPELDRPPFSLTTGQFGGNPNSLDVVGISFVADGFVPVTYALDGVDGSTIASHQATDVGTSPNRELILLPNPDNNGTDNLLLLHNTTYERLQIDLTPREAAVSYPPSNSRPQNSSVIDQGGQVGVFVKAFRNQAFVADTESQSTRWNTQLPPSLLSYVAGFSGFADANNDGTWDVMVPGVLGDVTVFDMLTGEVIYRRCLDGGSVADLPEPANLETCVPVAPVSSIIVADVDGDNAEEFVVGGADGWLYALNAEDGTASFAYDLGSQIFYPAVADMDGDGELEIALTTARSELVMIDHAEISSPTEVRDIEVDDDDQIVNGTSDIDITTRTSAAAVTWEAVPLATTFLVRLTTENNTDVVASTNVGLTTEHVATNLNLVAGTRYMWHVTAVSDVLGAAPAAITDGFLVTGDGPALVEALTISPNAFSPGEGQSAAVTAVIRAPGVTPLTEVTLSITNAVDTEVFSFSVNPGVSTYTVDQEWTGLISEGNPLPPGTYTVRLRGVDATTQSVEDEVTAEIIAPGAPTIANLTADPTPFIPGAGESTQLTATVSSVSIRPLTRVTVVITNGDDEAVRSTEWTEDLGSTYDLDFTWDGLDGNNAYVPAGTYTATVEAVDGFDSQVSETVEIVVEAAGPPTISDLLATPDVFTPGTGETSQLTAAVATQSVMPLTRVELTFLSEDDVPVRTMEWTEDLGENYDLDFTWDGRNQFSSLVAGGSYRARLTAEDGFGAISTSEVTVTVLTPGAPTLEDLAANPTEFDPRQGETTTVTGTIESGSVANIDFVRVRIFDENEANVTENIDTSGDSTTFALAYEWAGTYPNGSPVPGGEYDIEVTGRDALGSEVSGIVTVTITTPALPSLENFVATPDTFDPNLGETTVLTGTASSNTALVSSELVIRDADGNVVFTQSEAPGNADFELDATWSGTYPNNTVVTPGQYTASWTVTNGVSDAASADTTITVADNGSGDETADAGSDASDAGDTGPDATPDLGNPDVDAEEDENCTCETPARSEPGLWKLLRRR